MKTTKSALLVYAGALLVVVCFFLPWISVSFFGVSFSITGMNIASGGGSSEMKELASGFSSNPLLYIVPVLAIVAAVVAYVGSKKMGSKNAGILEIILGVVPLVYGIYQLYQANQELAKATKDAAELGLKMNIWNMIGIGLWGTGLGFVLVIVGGFLMMKESGSQPAQPVQPTEPAEPTQPAA